MKTSKYFVNTPKQKEIYEKILQSIGQYPQLKKDFPLSSQKKGIHLYLSCLIYQNMKSINTYHQKLYQIDDPQQRLHISGEILNDLYKKILSPIHLVRIFVLNNNQYFQKFSHPINNYQNPFLIDDSQIQKEFNTKKNSSIELYAKIMIWSSRLAKIVDIVKKDITAQSCRNPHNSYHLQRCGRVYENLKNQILLADSHDDVNLAKEFLNDYMRYLRRDKKKEDMLQQMPSYQKVQDIIQNYDKAKEYTITPQNMFQYLACALNSAHLYDVKAHYIELLMEDYAQNLSVKNLPYILQTYQDQRSRNKNYNADFIVRIPGYNTAFKVHTNKNLLNDLEKKYQITLKNEPDKANFPEFFHYKLNNKQKQLIFKYSQVRLKNPDLQSTVNYFIENLKEKNIPLKGEESHVR